MHSNSDSRRSACPARDVSRIGPATDCETLRNVELRWGEKPLVNGSLGSISPGSRERRIKLIIRRSQVQVLPAPPGKAQVTRHMWRRLRRRVSNLPRVCPAPVKGTARGFANTHVTSFRSAQASICPKRKGSAARDACARTGKVRLPPKTAPRVQVRAVLRSACIGHRWIPRSGLGFKIQPRPSTRRESVCGSRGCRMVCLRGRRPSCN
jgi:hypothetical protein